MSLHNRQPAPIRLDRLDFHPIDDAKRECRAFMVVRNERLRLPYVLDHHRGIGITRFFVVDNGSDDGSVDFLLHQPDCHVFETSDSYAAAWWGVDWVNHLVQRHGRHHWCLVIDADECLVYPGCEHLSLPALCGIFERHGIEGMLCVMIDMFSDKPVADTVYEGGPFLDACPFFDTNYRLRRRPGLSPFPPVEMFGGPRARHFFPEFSNSGIGLDLMRVLQFLRRKAGITGTSWAVTPPKLTKIPLILAGSGHWLDAHRTTRLRLAKWRGALLHFKYFSDFHDRVVTACVEGQHADAGTEYARYYAALQQNPGLSLYHPEAVRYLDSDDLLRHGLISADY